MRGHDEIAERVFSRGDRIIAEKQRKTAIIRRTVCAVSGLCAAAVIGFGVWSNSAVKNAVTPHPDDGYVNIEETKPTGTTTAATYTTVKTTSKTTTNAETTATVTSQDTTAKPVIHATSATTATARTTSTATATTVTTAATTGADTTENPPQTTTRHSNVTAPEQTTVPVSTPEELFTGMTTAATTDPHVPETATFTSTKPVTTPSSTTPNAPKWEDLPITQRFGKFERTFQTETSEGSTETKVYVFDGELFDMDRYGYKLITWREKRIYAYEITASGWEKKHSVVVKYAAISTNEPVEEDFVLQFPDDDNYYIYRYKETIIT